MSDADVPQDQELAEEDREAARLAAADGAVYDLDDLSEGDVRLLAEELAAEGVEFAFEADGDLVVAAADAEKADEIIAARFGSDAGVDEIVYDASELDEDQR